MADTVKVSCGGAVSIGDTVCVKRDMEDYGEVRAIKNEHGTIFLKIEKTPIDPAEDGWSEWHAASRCWVE